MPIYVSPLSSNDTPTGPIPRWFHGILTGPHAQFLQMVKSAWKMDDWGVAANLLCYQEYDKEYQKINTKIHQLQLDASAVEQDHALLYVNKGSKHLGVLKVSLTSKGWVPSPPMPSGAHSSWAMRRMMTRGPTLAAIAEDCNSEEEVMKQP
jgi:hypothetical protein